MPAGRTPLTRQRVLAAAVALADREGIEALTLRRLAEDLDVHPTSLYNHVASKVAILDGVVEVLFAEAALPIGCDRWQDWVRGLAGGLRELARAHPGAFMVLTRRPSNARQAYDLGERGVQAFQRAGFSPVEALQAVSGVSLALLGLALNECARMGDWIEPDPQEDLWPDHPRLRAAAAQVRPEDDDGHWEAVVQALVSGLQPGRA